MQIMKEDQTKQNYFEAIGRRKTSTARVRLHTSQDTKNSFLINGREIKEYFPTTEMRYLINLPFEIAEVKSRFNISATIKGGGIHSQAEALRHGISRALTLSDTELRKKLKKGQMLKRDPRAKERRKFGLKKARKAPQWSKR